MQTTQQRNTNGSDAKQAIASSSTGSLKTPRYYLNYKERDRISLRPIWVPQILELPSQTWLVGYWIPLRRQRVQPSSSRLRVLFPFIKHLVSMSHLNLCWKWVSNENSERWLHQWVYLQVLRSLQASKRGCLISKRHWG